MDPVAGKLPLVADFPQYFTSATFEQALTVIVLGELLVIFDTRWR